MKRLASLMILALGCGGSDDAEITCDIAERSGTYLADFTTVDGNCGEQATAVVRLDATAAMGGCVVVGENLVSADQCSLTSTIACPLDQVEPGATAETTLISRQETDNGSRISGTMTIEVFGSDGVSICFGTYRVDARRQ